MIKAVIKYIKKRKEKKELKKSIKSYIDWKYPVIYKDRIKRILPLP